MKILLVEDGVFFGELVTEFLSIDGHTVLLATDGLDALDLLAANTFDLIITDMFMPNMDGTDFIAELSAQGNHIPIIAMSGGRKKITAENGIELAKILGVTTVLIKPFLRTDLQQAIQQVVTNQGQILE